MTGYSDPVAGDMVLQARQQRGQRAYCSGKAAEDTVERDYEARGAVLAARRWRRGGGEIDLIFLHNDVVVFVEVKKARSFEAALASLTEAQMIRIHAAASEYLGHTPKGQLSEVRFDLALVNDTGQLRVTENAFGHF